MSPEEFIAHLETKSEDELQFLIEGFVHHVGMEGEGEERAFPEDDIKSLARLMAELGFLPEGTQVPA
jgi:hypothetical protein